MAESNPASDSQALLQSMLQRLKLHTHSDSSTHGHVRHTGGVAQSRTDTKTQNFVVSSHRVQTEQPLPPAWTKLDGSQNVLSPTARDVFTTFSKSSSEKAQGLALTPIPSPGGLHDHPMSDNITSGVSQEEVPKWTRRQLRFSLREDSVNKNNMAQVQSVDTGKKADKLDLLRPATAMPTPESEEPRIQGWDRGLGDAAVVKTTANSSISEQMKRSTSKRQWMDLRARKWTKKVKERWREKHSNLEKMPKEHVKNYESQTSPTNPPQIRKENTDSITSKEEGIVCQPLLTERQSEAPPSPISNFSDFGLSFGSMNLMEEIFTGEEWAKFLSPISSTIQDQARNQATESPDRMLASPPDITDSQLDSRKPLNPYLDLDLAQTFIANVTHVDMEISDIPKTAELTLTQSQSIQNVHDLPQDSASGLNLSQTSELNPNQPQSNRPTLDQPQVSVSHDTQISQQEAYDIKTVEQHLYQSQVSEVSHHQGNKKEDTIPLIDFSCLKPADGSSLNNRTSLRGKRGYNSRVRGGDERGYTGHETEMDEDRGSALKPSLDVLSQTSSVSSGPFSIAQDSEASISMETATKRRRVEDTRQVRFAEEVVMIPTLEIYEDEDYDDDDDDDNDDDVNDDEEDEDVNDSPDEALQAPSRPKWIMALKKRATWKPRF